MLALHVHRTRTLWLLQKSDCPVCKFDLPASRVVALWRVRMYSGHTTRGMHACLLELLASLHICREEEASSLLTRMCSIHTLNPSMHAMTRDLCMMLFSTMFQSPGMVGYMAFHSQSSYIDPSCPAMTFINHVLSLMITIIRDAIDKGKFTSYWCL